MGAVRAIVMQPAYARRGRRRKGRVSRIPLVIPAQAGIQKSVVRSAVVATFAALGDNDVALRVRGLVEHDAALRCRNHERVELHVPPAPALGYLRLAASFRRRRSIGPFAAQSESWGRPSTSGRFTRGWRSESRRSRRARVFVHLVERQEAPLARIASNAAFSRRRAAPRVSAPRRRALVGVAFGMRGQGFVLRRRRSC